MKSVLRQFIRESLVREAVGMSTYTGPKVVPYAKSRSGSTLIDYTLRELTDEKDGTIAKALNNFSTYMESRKTGKLTPTRNTLVSIMRAAAGAPASTANPVLSRKKDAETAAIAAATAQKGSALTQAEIDAVRKKAMLSPLKKQLLISGGVALVLALAAAGAYLYYSSGDDQESAEKSADALQKFHNNVLEKIDQGDLSKELSYTQPVTTFEQSWAEMKNFYQEEANKIASVQSYDDFFSKIVVSSLKSSIDSLINAITTDENLKSLYEEYALGCIIYATVKAILPSAMYAGAKQLSDYDQHSSDVAEFIESINSMLMSSKCFLSAQAMHKKLELV